MENAVKIMGGQDGRQSNRNWNAQSTLVIWMLSAFDRHTRGKGKVSNIRVTTHPGVSICFLLLLSCDSHGLCRLQVFLLIFSRFGDFINLVQVTLRRSFHPPRHPPQRLDICHFSKTRNIALTISSLAFFFFCFRILRFLSFLRSCLIKAITHFCSSLLKSREWDRQCWYVWSNVDACTRLWIFVLHFYLTYLNDANWDFVSFKARKSSPKCVAQILRPCISWRSV